MPLTKDELKKLIQILGMLGSAHDGEIVNAARLAQRLLGQANLTWAELIRGIPGAKYTDEDMRDAINYARKQGYEIGKAEGSAKPLVSFEETFAEYATRMLDDYSGYLTDWEIGFCESWEKLRYRPTAAQYEKFLQIAAKTGQPCPERR